MDIPIDYKQEIEFMINMDLNDDEYMLLFNIMYNMYFNIGKMPRETLGLTNQTIRRWELSIIADFHRIKLGNQQEKKQEDKQE